MDLNLNSCPACREGDGQQEYQHAAAQADPSSRVICDCGLCGPWEDSMDCAAEAWNNLVMAETVVEAPLEASSQCPLHDSDAYCVLAQGGSRVLCDGSAPVRCPLLKGPIVIRAREE